MEEEENVPMEEEENIPVDITKYIFYDKKNKEWIQFVNMQNEDAASEQIQEDIKNTEQ